ncbi:pimeloyl-ACP methyl ester carboxylesterase [Streptomyces sp. 1114.5]|uniref:alpha/beta fold hydrolase n=1 Tax=Streptomyces sp. 1114.5 TaxID=1938830 RepID=UPI000EB46899|nr:alpha/beta hydrolase [Streptomyces sp. 1114.5]RKT09512.1 pimeloyl-ACP methyl ester carboxylesterase [Streptomyces sp. 1114.5]
MEFFTSYDGTTLAFRTLGDGPPLICLPGGPGRAADYLGDLGGLSAHRTLILPDTRGTGGSAMPADLATCRVDRLVADVEALRHHLGLDRVDLLGHSAGGSLAMLYAAAHPDRLTSLTLVTPSFAAVGLPSDTGVDEVIAARAAEPWHAEAVTAHRHMKTANTFAEAAPYRFAFEPLMYGRWDDAARAHAAADPAQRSLPVSEHYYKDYTPDSQELRRRLGALPSPVLLLAGEVDLWPTAKSAADAASLFPEAKLAIQPGAGHYPWLDDPQAFTAKVEGFLSEVS